VFDPSPCLSASRPSNQNPGRALDLGRMLGGPKMPDGRLISEREAAAKPWDGRFGEAGIDPKTTAARHAEAIAAMQPERHPLDKRKPWVERLGRHFLLTRDRGDP
jgi:hypothetical protein